MSNPLWHNQPVKNENMMTVNAQSTANQKGCRTSRLARLDTRTVAAGILPAVEGARLAAR